MDTKGEIIDLAENLIKTKGYHSFSYKDISTVLGIKNAAIHYHFPAKADLGKSIIERTRINFNSQTKSWIDLNPKEKLRSFLDIYEKNHKSNLVCFMGSLGPSYNTLPENMRKSLTEASLEIRNWVINLLEYGLESGHFQFSEKPEKQADLIISSLMASLVLNRVTGLNILSSVDDIISDQLIK